MHFPKNFHSKTVFCPKISRSWKKFRSNNEHLHFHKFSFAADNETDVFYTNLNEIDHIHYDDHRRRQSSGEQFTVLPIDPRTNSIVDRVQIDMTGQKQANSIFNKFPTKSKLNRGQQQTCLRALHRIHTPYEQLNQSEKANRDAYHQLLPKIDPENQEFNQFVRSYFMANLVARKRKISPPLNSFVENNWRRNVGKLLLADDQRYQLQSALPLTSDLTPNAQVSVKFVETLKQTGWIPRSKFEITHTTYSHLRRCLDQMSHLQDQKLKSQAACRNTLVDELLEDRDLDIITNLSTLIQLCNFPDNTMTAWSVPFEIVGREDNASTIILQKPLPPLAMSTHSRNMKAHKYAFKSSFLHFQHKSAFSLERNLKLGDIPELTPPVESKKRATREDEPFRVQDFDEYLREVQKRLTPAENNEFFSNTTCRLHELQTELGDPLKMAVITHQDCCEKIDGQLVNLNLSLKLEFQPEFGAEEMSKAELIREWFRLRFGDPKSKNMRVRIDAQTSNCLTHQYLDLAAIEEELQRLYACRPSDLLRQFHSTMTIVRTFPEGQYLLRHDEKNADKVMIYQRIESAAGSTLSLHEQYSTAVQYERSHLEHHDWTKIDRLLATQAHLRSCVLPGIFPHWGNKTRLIQDRVKVVVKPAKLTPQQRKKAKKVQKRKEKTKKSRKAGAKVNKVPAGEALDPRELFNASGEIDDGFLTRTPEKIQSWAKVSTVESPKFVDIHQPIDVSAYINEARNETESPPMSANPSLNALQGYGSDSSEDFLGFGDR
jgi:NMDA receptor-regulated gene protein 2 C-terminus